MTSTLRLGAVRSALQSLFPPEVSVAVVQITAATLTELWPEERSAMTGAVQKRLDDFCAGRAAARQALADLGHNPVAIPMGSDRAPVWPSSVSGTIAHAAGLAVAVARYGPALGVDIEEDLPLDPELWPIICNSSELARLSPSDRGRLVRHIFAAKEALFKAQEPDQRAVFGFDAVSVTLADCAFDAQFCIDVGAFRSGQILHGRLAHLEGIVLAGVAK